MCVCVCKKDVFIIKDISIQEHLQLAGKSCVVLGSSLCEGAGGHDGNNGRLSVHPLEQQDVRGVLRASTTSTAARHTTLGKRAVSDVSESNEAGAVRLSFSRSHSLPEALRV